MRCVLQLTVCNRQIILPDTNGTLAEARATAVSAITSAFADPSPPVALVCKEKKIGVVTQKNEVCKSKVKERSHHPVIVSVC